MFMTLMGWVALGLVIGFLANLIVFRKGEDRQLDVLFGVAGAVVGGLTYKLFGTAGASAFSTRSLLPAVVGAAAVLIIWHAVKGSISRA
jgi:uncharacterized membrane protein YeaQ/YmgE (transglycosylase-associated protein family)